MSREKNEDLSVRQLATRMPISIPITEKTASIKYDESIAASRDIDWRILHSFTLCFFILNLKFQVMEHEN